MSFEHKQLFSTNCGETHAYLHKSKMSVTRHTHTHITSWLPWERKARALGQGYTPLPTVPACHSLFHEPLGYQGL